jgi:internalin A
MPGLKSADVEMAERRGRLDLSGRQLAEFPPELGQLTNLHRLQLDGNTLTALPPEIGQLTKLEDLWITGNGLTALPPEIGQLTNLQTLRLDHNMLTALPPQIGQLTKLKTLWLDGNGLAALPPEIGRLTNLQTLRLNQNRLKAVPPEVISLTGLQELWLNYNGLAALPPEITQLTSLRSLRLDNNGLATLPEQITSLTSLRELWLNSNWLAALPPEITQLTNLHTLRLDHNGLTALPEQITSLTSLRELWLDGNGLTALPAEITQLAGLRIMRLEGNALTALPPEIGQLSSLRELWLDNNRLTMLPRQLADLLTNGLLLSIERNPLADPLPELIGGRTENLAIYLRSLEDAIAHYEAKILLVGEGNVGKTSLSAALRGKAFVEGLPFTHGIEIWPLALPHPDTSMDMTLRLWDFGGQEVYRVTHQFFFSPRGLYLVVWNPREGQEHDEVEGWLRRIRLRAVRDARALVVATHCLAGQQPDLDYPRLLQLFPELLAGRFAVDNESGDGIEELKNAIAAQAALLPQMGQLISSRWVAVRQAVADLAQSEPQISFEAFTDICQDHHVYGDEIETLAVLMHEVGQIIYYGDDEGLQDFVVLNPEWLTKAISYVLRDEQTRNAAGELDHRRLREIWQDRTDGPGYPVRYHRYFLRLMEKFDICYRLGEHHSLVAQLVPYERPFLPWDFGSPLPARCRRLSLVCRFGEQAPGLMAWLTVQRHPDATGLHWRNGVFLRYRISAYASEALLELRNPDQLDLAVEVRAPSPDFFFHVVSDTIETLIASRWPGLKHEMLIPCPASSPGGSPCDGLIPVHDLVVYREEGLNTYLCTTCRIRHDVTALLTGFSPTAAAEPEQDLLTQIASGVARIEEGIGQVAGEVAEVADRVRQVLKAVSAEVNDCPLLFTLAQIRPQGVHRLRVDRQHFRLTLWCEHSDHWHPWAGATYEFDQPQEWLVKISPYANLILTILRSAVPAAAATAGVVMTAEQLKHASSELQLMTVLASELPSLESGTSAAWPLEPSSAQPSAQAQGQAMRAIRTVIFERDPARAFGDMRRVLTAAGDYLWICPDHYGSYDPGLPAIPGS